MLEHLPFLQKLWDKGIDISASVITSVIVGFLAWAAWRVKIRQILEEDALKLRQAHELKQSLEAPEKKRAADARYLRLAEQRDAHAATVQACTNATELIAAWDNYKRWLDDENLRYTSRNIDLIRPLANENDHMRENAHTARLAESLSQVIRRTDIG